jgi:hypothetical protein
MIASVPTERGRRATTITNPDLTVLYLKEKVTVSHKLMFHYLSNDGALTLHVGK